MTVSAYPLAWPQGFPRWKASRSAGAFRTDFESALRNVRKSLEAFAKDSGKAVSQPVLSSNIDLNPLTSNTGKRPADPGVAVWFVWDGLQVCIPVDRYDSPAANLQAIHHIIEARRTELRHSPPCPCLHPLHRPIPPARCPTWSRTTMSTSSCRAVDGYIMCRSGHMLTPGPIRPERNSRLASSAASAASGRRITA